MDSALASHLVIFVATRADAVPAGCRRVLSVDGTVPGFAVRWDHHTTGEPINLDAMPERLDPTEFDGVGTTLADMDAVASVVAVLFGGKGALPAQARAALESASHWCDHLGPHPAHDADVNRLGRGLLDAVAAQLEVPAHEISRRFAQVSRALAEKIAAGAPLPFDDRWERALADAQALVRAGRLLVRGDVALADSRGLDAIDPLALYAQHGASVGVSYARRPDGGLAYTVGANPLAKARLHDLGAALRALAAAEFAHGPPACSPEPIPGAENWGGRATVFGSPWNYGSRLTPDEVVAIVARALGLGQ